jgi:hypothetical protein
MVHWLVPALEVIVGLSAPFIVAALVIGIVELYASARRRLRATADYERYRAEQSIRDLKRSAIRELLDVERAHRGQIEHYADVIEGTAVEIEPR